MRKFCEGLAEVISKENVASHSHKSGFGEIRLNSEVARIRIDHGKVEGVKLRDGTKIDAMKVISNADYKTTFLNLIEPKEVPSAWLSAISDARQTKSNFQVCLGLDVSKVDVKPLIKQATEKLLKEKAGNLLKDATGDLLKGRLEDPPKKKPGDLLKKKPGDILRDRLFPKLKIP